VGRRVTPHSLKAKIITPRIEETRDFYTGLFGLVVAEEWDEPGDRGCILAFPDGKGEAFIEIYQGEAQGEFGGLSLQLRTADLDGFAAGLPPELARRGPVERPWGSRYLYLTDPNGIEIVVFEGGL